MALRHKIWLLEVKNSGKRGPRVAQLAILALENFVFAIRIHPVKFQDEIQKSYPTEIDLKLGGGIT